MSNFEEEFVDRPDNEPAVANSNSGDINRGREYVRPSPNLALIADALETFVNTGVQVTVAELVKATGLPRASVSNTMQGNRINDELAQRGFVAMPGVRKQTEDDSSRRCYECISADCLDSYTPAADYDPVAHEQFLSLGRQAGRLLGRYITPGDVRVVDRRTGVRKELHPGGLKFSIQDTDTLKKLHDLGIISDEELASRRLGVASVAAAVALKSKIGVGFLTNGDRAKHLEELHAATQEELDRYIGSLKRSRTPGFSDRKED